MDPKTVKIVIGVVLVVVAIPTIPKVLQALKGPGPALDAQNLKRIQEAVQDFTYDAGYFPSSLSALVPDYLDAVPITNDGKAFTYDARTSAVSMPVKATANAREPTGSGLSPVGDAFTGLSVQNELDF